MTRRKQAGALAGRVVTGDSLVRTGQDDVRTTEDVVPDLVTPAVAARCLRDRFGATLEDDYIPGKTALRDTLTETFGISELMAEDLCDELERAGVIAFIQDEERFGWDIRAGDPGAPQAVGARAQANRDRD